MTNVLCSKKCVGNDMEIAVRCVGLSWHIRILPVLQITVRRPTSIVLVCLFYIVAFVYFQNFESHKINNQQNYCQNKILGLNFFT